MAQEGDLMFDGFRLTRDRAQYACIDGMFLLGGAARIDLTSADFGPTTDADGKPVAYWGLQIGTGGNLVVRLLNDPDPVVWTFADGSRFDGVFLQIYRQMPGSPAVTTTCADMTCCQIFPPTPR